MEERMNAVLQKLDDIQAQLKLNDPENDDTENEIAIVNEMLANIEAEIELTEENLEVECDRHKRIDENGKSKAFIKDQAKKSNKGIFNINSLPKSIMIKIFGYIDQYRFGRLTRVCRRWRILIRSPELWKTADIYFGCRFWGSKINSQNKVALSLTSILSLSTSSIKLNYQGCCDSLPLNFEDFSLNLHRVCPYLEVLVFRWASFTCSFSSVMHLCVKFLPNIRFLYFFNCRFTDCSLKVNCDGISKLETLHIRWCYPLSEIPFSKMPFLEELHVRYACDVDSLFKEDTSFSNNLEILRLSNGHFLSAAFHVSDVAHNVTELYLCFSSVTDNDFLSFNASSGVFPNLEVICIFATQKVSMTGILALIHSCPSLQKIYLCADIWEDESYAVQPYANNPQLEIIKVGHLSTCCDVVK